MLSINTIASVLCSALLVAGCSTSKASQQFFADKELELDIKGFSWASAESSDTDDDGDAELAEDGDVSLGGEVHDVDVSAEDDADNNSGGKITMTVVDQKTGNKRIYGFDPATYAFSITETTDAITVVQNEDKTYSVNGEAAANGKAAVALMKNSPLYADASAWGFAMTYSICQDCMNHAATRTQCGRVTQRGEVREAKPVAICDIFRDLCDCALCDKLGKASCTKCP